MSRLFVLAAAVLAAVTCATAAAAEDRVAPWLSATTLTLTPFEQQLSAVGSAIARKPVRIACLDKANWDALMRFAGRDPLWTSGIAYRTLGDAFLTEVYCNHLSAFAANPERRGMKECQTGTRTEYKVETKTEMRMQTQRRVEWVSVRKRIKKKGKWTWVTSKQRRVVEVQVEVPVETTVQTPVEVPIFGMCGSYANTSYGLMLLTHESMHLSGIREEATAECYALQAVAQTARSLGAPREFALEIAADRLAAYNNMQPAAKAQGYWSEECRDGGALDLNPGAGEWPTPAATVA